MCSCIHSMLQTGFEAEQAQNWPLECSCSWTRSLAACSSNVGSCRRLKLFQCSFLFVTLLCKCEKTVRPYTCLVSQIPHLQLDKVCRSSMRRGRLVEPMGADFKWSTGRIINHGIESIIATKRIGSTTELANSSRN